jgi:hypothetical protein
MEQDQEIPRLTSKTKGKKRKACDRCVRLKKACSQGYPCEGCREKKDACTLDGVAQGLRGHEDEEETPSQPNSGVSVATEHAKLDAWHDEDQINHNGLVFDQPDPGTDIEFLMEDERSWDFLNHWSLDLEESRRNPSARSVEHLLGVNNGQETEEIRQFAPEFDLAELGKFPFLARFTTETGFVKSFECGTLAERQAIVREIRNHEYNLKSQVANSGGHTQSLLSNPDIGPISPPRLGFDSRWDNQYFNSTTLQPGPHQFQPAKESHNILQSMDIPMSPSIAFQSNVEVLHDSQESETLWSAWLSDSLAHKTYEIVDRIKDITLYRLRGSKIAINWSPPVERMCLDFFSPPNIRKHLALFWSCWYPNCPIIHRPSFEATRASPLLIASMVLLGACISPDNRDHAGANIWLNSVEEMIFSCEEFCDEINASMGNSTLEILAMQRRLEALHAAYFISLVQNWEGSEESRRRIRRHRYNAIIAVSWSSQSLADLFSCSYKLLTSRLRGSKSLLGILEYRMQR